MAEPRSKRLFCVESYRRDWLGWCEIQNAGSHKEDIDLIKKAFGVGKIKIRFVNAVYGPGEDAQRFLRDGATINIDIRPSLLPSAPSR